MSTIDLKIFEPKYRQALLFTMIEGLRQGGAFFFIDDRSSTEIEKELASAKLDGYRWKKQNENIDEGASYMIERIETVAAAETCCGCCCGSAKP